MARRVSPKLSNEDEQVASPDVSRLLVLGFVIAAILGALGGVLWMLSKLIG